jgi:SRSO17 transposase
MEPRFQQRKAQLLADCQVPPTTFRGAVNRLEIFAQPFVASLPSPESQQYTRTYLSGLVSDVEHKNAEAIAYRYDLDRQTLQHYLGTSPWDHQPPLDELNRQVATVLGCANAVLVFDPSAFPKKGTASVGVQRQWCGRLGKSDNCQVGVYLGYVTDWGHALVDFRLYLPEEWAKDRKRRKRCGVPKNIRFRTRHQLALEMLERRGSMLPHGWISGDDEMGRPAWFRQELAARHENYLLAVPSNTSIRDLEAERPPYGGHGPHPKTPFLGVRDWCEALSEESWTRLTVRDGEKGPLEVGIVKRRVKSKIERRVMAFEELLVVVRHEEGGKMKYDYHLSNAAPTTPLAELARVANAEHRVEECLKRGKSEAGLGDYQVRNWLGWHHHQALSLIAAWFLVQETSRGKKGGAGADVAAGPDGVGTDLSEGMWMRHGGAKQSRADTVAGANRVGTDLPLRGT